MSTTQRITTAEQLLEAGDLGPCELVHGELRMMTPAGFWHGRIVGRIFTVLSVYVTERDLGVVTGDDTGYTVMRNPDTVYAPDVAFVRKDRLPPPGEPGYFQGAPDLAAEVLSPGNTKRHIEGKIADYFAAGTRLVWVIDPHRKSAVIHRPGVEPVKLTLADALRGEDVVPGFELPLADIFAGL